MKLLISPAKKMRVDVDFLAPETQPQLLHCTEKLLEYLKGLTFPELKKLLACNDSLAEEAYRNFQKMDLGQGETPAILAYDGIQYKYMAPGLFSQGALTYIKDHLRILSGFYGVLRPLDGVSPYRLEMQAKVKGEGFQNLYQFWGDSIGQALEKEDDLFINLASEEYAKAVRPILKANARWITCVFGEESPEGKLVEKGVYVKMARGEMVRFAAEKEIQTPEELQGFDRLGYRFSAQHSREDTYVFCRKEEASKTRGRNP